MVIIGDDMMKRRNSLVDFAEKMGEILVIEKKYGIRFDPLTKSWVKPLTLEEAQKIVDDVDADRG